MKIFNQKQIKAVAILDKEALHTIENAFRALGEGRVTMPPVLSMDIAENNGEVDVKTAHIHGLSRFAIKISPGFFDNPKLGLPSLNGLIVLFSAKSGLVDAVLFDEGYLTDLRTALAGALSCQYLAREDAKTVTVIGAGLQARLQVHALRLVRPIEHINVWARDPQKAAVYQENLQQETGLKVVVHHDIATACANTDIIITTTPTTKPLLNWAHLPAGVHITAMGSDNPHKRELEASILQKADHVVVDRLSQSELIGELKGLDVTKTRQVHELGNIIATNQKLRQHRDEISVCDLTGTGVQDTAIANFTMEKLSQNN